jgi:hypothetical protein
MVGFETVKNVFVIVGADEPALNLDCSHAAESYFGSRENDVRIPFEQMSSIRGVEFHWFLRDQPDHLKFLSLEPFFSRKTGGSLFRHVCTKPSLSSTRPRKLMVDRAADNRCGLQKFRCLMFDMKSRRQRLDNDEVGSVALILM